MTMLLHTFKESYILSMHFSNLVIFIYSCKLNLFECIPSLYLMVYTCSKKWEFTLNYETTFKKKKTTKNNFPFALTEEYLNLYYLFIEMHNYCIFVCTVSGFSVEDIITQGCWIDDFVIHCPLLIYFSGLFVFQH